MQSDCGPQPSMFQSRRFMLLAVPAICVVILAHRIKTRNYRRKRCIEPSQDAGRWLSQAPVQREQAVFVAHSGFQAAYVLESADDKQSYLFVIVRVTCSRRAIPRCVCNRLQPGGPVYNNQQSVSTIPVAVYNYRQLGPPGILLILSPIIYRTVSIHPSMQSPFPATPQNIVSIVSLSIDRSF